jgi:MFS family permease
VLPASLAALGATAAGPAMATGPWTLAAACLLVGACSGAADAAVNAAASAAEASGGRALSLGHGMFSSCAVAAGLGTAGLLRATTSTAPLLAAGAAVVGAGATALALPTARLVRTPAPAAGARARQPKTLLLLGGLGALAYLVENAWQSWAAVHLSDTLGAAPSLAVAGPVVFAASAALGRFAGHPLQNRLTPAALVAGGGVLASAGSAVVALAGTVPLALAGLAVAGLGASVCAPTLIGLAGRAAPDRAGAATGTVITLSYLGFVVGPAAVGGVAALTGLRTALAAVAGTALLVAAGARALPRR